MILTYAIDYPDRVAYVTRTGLDDAGISAQTLTTAAARNMDAKMQQVRFEGNGSVYFAALDGFYESSLILDDVLWADLSQQLGDDLVISVAARDLIVLPLPAAPTGSRF